MIDRLRKTCSCCLRAALLLVAWLPAAPAAAQTLWEMTPYRVRVYLAYENAPQLTATCRDDLERLLSERIGGWIGSSWNAEVLAAPAELALAMNASAAKLSVEDVPSGDLQLDKVFCLHVRVVQGRMQFEAREFDVRTRTWGSVVNRTAEQPALAATAAFDTVMSAFAPLARVETVHEKEVKLRLRAASLPMRDDDLSVVTPGWVFRPILRFNDREGQLRADRPPLPIPWTWLLVRQVEQSAAQCEMYSGLRSPLSIRRRGRSEQLALAVRTPQAATDLVVHSRIDASRRLFGYEVHAYAPDSPETTLLGRTDSEGKLAIKPAESPLRILVIKNGGEFLARLPMVPGVDAEAPAAVADDDYRLAVEGYINGVQEEVVDLVARRGTLMARIRARIDDGKLDEAESLLDELRQLRTRDELVVLLNEQRKKYFSSDASIRRKITKMFDDTIQVMVRNLNPGDIDQVASELSQARQGAPAKAASATESGNVGGE